MASSIYIYARASDWSGPVEKITAELYFGPFSEEEEKDRLNDAYADYLEADGFEVITTSLTDKEALKYAINPRESWMDLLAKLQE